MVFVMRGELYISLRSFILILISRIPGTAEAAILVGMIFNINRTIGTFWGLSELAKDIRFLATAERSGPTIQEQMSASGFLTTSGIN